MVLADIGEVEDAITGHADGVGKNREQFERGCSNHRNCECLYLLPIRDKPAAVREQTFAALAPNAVGMIRSKLQSSDIEMGAINSVVILGCGIGHSARAFAQLFQADVYGIDNQQYLLDEWNREKDLLDNNQETRSVVSRIQLELGDITGDSETMATMKGKLKSADLVFCWNSLLDDETNNAMFELVSHNIKQNGILVCTTLATIETGLVQNDDMRIRHADLDPQTEYTFTLGPGTIGRTDGFLFYRRQVPCPISHIRLPARVRQLECIKCPEEYVRRSLTKIEARYIDYDGWWEVRKEDVLVGKDDKDGGSVLSESFLVALVNCRRHKVRAERGLAAPAGWRGVGGSCTPVEVSPQPDAPAVRTQSLDGVGGRYCVLHAAIDAIRLLSPPSAEMVAAVLIEDAQRKPRSRQYEDLQLITNNASFARHRPSLAGLLHQTFGRRLFELHSRGRVVASGECCSPTELLAAQPPGVYVAILEDKDGDHGHAVAFDLRCGTTATIWDASDTDPKLPLSDANLQRCCAGVRCVGCHRLALILHTPAKQKRFVTGSGKTAKERARQAALRRRKRQRQPTSDTSVAR